MSIQESVKELNKIFKEEKEKTLENKIEELEKIIINLNDRLSYLESRQCL